MLIIVFNRCVNIVLRFCSVCSNLPDEAQVVMRGPRKRADFVTIEIILCLTFSSLVFALRSNAPCPRACKMGKKTSKMASRHYIQYLTSCQHTMESIRDFSRGKPRLTVKIGLQRHLCAENILWCQLLF